MKIKEDKRLEVGTEIKLSMKIEGLEPEEYDVTKTHQKTIKLLVVANYPHHTQFKMLYRPYSTVCITNQELYQRGIYKSSDFEREFTPKETEING